MKIPTVILLCALLLAGNPGFAEDRAEVSIEYSYLQLNLALTGLNPGNLKGEAEAQAGNRCDDFDLHDEIYL